MKLKEINRTAIQAWSPAQQHPVYLAAGTSAQQLDASFSTSASLEIFELDLAEPTLSMKSCGTFSSSHRYHKLVWGPHGMDAQGHPSGVLIAGGENGDIILYDPAKIIAGDSDAIISQNDKHTGPVRALDVNPFQTNLVASGGNESEIYIWDLNNFGTPMTPGPKTQPLEDISCVAWNRQVQHILASASPSGRASVWDLRKNDLIIKVSDHSNRMHCSGLAWNPEVATQLVLASEDDRMPVIQMWDLRFATSPLKVLENHTRGILAIAWSLADPELLLSCGKDNRILCWNPNTAEVLYELPTSTQWCFDIQWCPRNPAVLSAAAFDGHISIYSIMGGSNQNESQQPADQISTSFGNMDPFGMGQALPPLQLPQSTAPKTTITPLKKPPKWIRRPVGASFAFGGKLVTLENVRPTPQQPQQPTLHIVHVSQVVTETDFLDRSDKLQATMTAGSFVDFCQSKIETAQSEFERTMWSFLKVNFEDDTRGKYLELLGYKKEELALKIEAALQKEDIVPEEPVSAPDAEPQPVPVPALEPVSEPPPALHLQPGPELDRKVAGEPLIEPGSPPTELYPEPVLVQQPELAPGAPLDVTPEVVSPPLLDAVPESQVQFKTEPQSDVIPGDQLDHLTEPQLDVIPEAQIDIVPEAGLDDKPEAQPAILPEAQIDIVPEAGLDDKPEAQPAILPEAQFDPILETQPLIMPEPQLDLLSEPQFDVLAQPQLLGVMPEPQIHFPPDPQLGMPEPYQHPLPEPQFDLIPDSHFSLIPDPQLSTAPFAPIPASQFDPIQTQQFDLMQTQPFDPIQTQQFDPIQTQQFDLMQTQQFDPMQTQQFDPIQTQQFDPIQTQQFDPVQTQPFDPVQMQQFASIPLQQFEPVPPTQVDPVPLQQFEPVPPTQVDPVPLQQFEPVPPTQVDPVPAQLVEPVPPTQVEPIPVQQVDSIPEPQVEPVPVQQVDSIPEPQVEPVPPPQVDHIPVQQVDPIPEPQFDVEPEPQLDLEPPVDLPNEHQLDPELEPEPEIDLEPEEMTDAEPAVQEDEIDLGETEEKETEEEVCVEATEAINLKVNEGVDGLITEALLTGDFESAVELCLRDNRMADSIILAIAGGPGLLEKTQKKYFEKTKSKITKLISAVVTKDWRDILETCDLQNWKEALAAVMTYASPEEFSSLCGLLGSRLEADGGLQPQACLCYICAGNVEKLVACWARAQESHSPLSLQDLVEKVVVLRKAVEQTQGSSPVVVGTLLAEKMSQYAGLLASQGSLLTAIAYLPENSDQVTIQHLRERLRRALGEEAAKPAPSAAPGPAQPAQPAMPSPPMPAPVAAPAAQAYTPIQPPHTPHPPQPTPVPTAPPQYYQQVRSASTITSWSNQTPTALPSIPAPVGPGPDPQSPVQTEPPPPGFVMPPQAPASSAAGYPYPQQYPQTYPHIPHYMPGAGVPAVYQPHQYAAAAHPPLPPSSSSPLPAYPPYMHSPTSHPLHPVFPGSSPAVSGGPPPLAPPPTSSFSPPPLSSGASFQHGGPGAPAPYLPPPPTGPTGGLNGQDTACFMEGPQNGWNDPPALSRLPKKKKVPENYTPPAPITSPIMAPLGGDPQAPVHPQAPPTLQPQQLPPGQPGVQGPYPGHQQPLAPPPGHPARPPVNVEGAPGAPIGDVIQPVRSLPAEKITKKPIPEEHLILKTTFEGLIQKCLAAAADPQTKRKLDDANKRLESLYDKLREKTLSPAIVGGLHNMARSIEARSYADSLNIHTHIVSSSNFSETSAFMPVLKVVLTQANKLGV
ncbi:protein transport protein Sec31A isoform X2 [Conger conger]|uniref:protein transport protein Sec31A isoform X2 n=1 Tax=Conger conger TaxID=82655 RepID=UPI002A5A2A61|nr:protein transport protein Sec31A isoform X2 [Conger conger]